MEKLIVSMMRFSTAMTLFGMEQMQSVVSTMSGDSDVKGAMDKFRKAIDAMTDRLAEEIDDAKKENLNSLTRISEDTVHRTWKGMNVGLMDPNEAIRTTTDVLKKTSDSVAEWLTKEDEKDSDPQPAAKVLS